MTSSALKRAAPSPQSPCCDASPQRWTPTCTSQQVTTSAPCVAHSPILTKTQSRARAIHPAHCMHLAPAENLIHAGGSRCMGETDVVRDGGRWGARAAGERCGMVIDRAAATGLSRCDERVRVAATAADEQ